MKRLFLTLSIGAFAIFGLNSCSDDASDGGGEKRPYCEIEKFSVPVPNVDAKIDKEKAIVELYVAPDLLDLLSDVMPAGELSIGASVVPALSVKQDFTKPVTYLVTAEDGRTQKTWTVKPVVSKYVAQGVGTVSRAWVKRATEVGLSVNEPTIAVFEDKVIASRPGIIINGATGENTGEKLNIEGILCNPANEATLLPFVVANDSKGNLLGATLGAWALNNNPWKVYKWTLLNAAPVEVISHLQMPTESFGRRLTAIGDINGNAIITSLSVSNYNLKEPTLAAAPAAHYCWKITNGVVNTIPELVAVPVYRAGNMYQMMWPESELSVKPFYFNDPGAANAVPVTRLGYVNNDNISTFFKGGVDQADIMGGVDEMFKETGYGRKVLDTRPFTFNGVKYMAVCSFYSTEVGTGGATEDKIFLYTQLLEISGKDYKVVYVGKDIFDGKMSSLNPNGTGSIAVSGVKEGSGADEGELNCRVYNLCSGVGLVGYTITNVKN